MRARLIGLVGSLLLAAACLGPARAVTLDCPAGHYHTQDGRQYVLLSVLVDVGERTRFRVLLFDPHLTDTHSFSASGDDLSAFSRLFREAKAQALAIRLGQRTFVSRWHTIGFYAGRELPWGQYVLLQIDGEDSLKSVFIPLRRSGGFERMFREADRLTEEFELSLPLDRPPTRSSR